MPPICDYRKSLKKIIIINVDILLVPKFCQVLFQYLKFEKFFISP